MIKNFFGHFYTITHHRHEVIKNCIKAGIFWQGLFHDLSKYSPTEFFVGVKHYQGYRSPNAEEREMYGYSKAWLHHKGRNKHHFEYWTDYDEKTKKLVPIEMPKKYLVEMFCDRVAASKIYKKKDYTNSSPLEYFLLAKGVRFVNDKTSDTLEGFLRMLAQKGEKETFKALREYLKSKD